MTKRPIQNPLDLPRDVADMLLPFIADVIEFAQQTAPGKWGLTDYDPDVRINVGFTEVLTTDAESGILRLIVDSTMAEHVSLPSNAQIETGKSGSAFYPSIPKSACVEVPFRPLNSLQTTLEVLRPALFEAIAKSGRRGLGKGVRDGHSPDLVREIARFVGRLLPQPDHAIQSRISRGPASRSVTPVALMEGALR